MGLNHARRRAVLLSFAAALLAVPPSASAQAQAAWKPTRPVTIIVPYSPGGGTDVMARQLAKELARRWEQPVNVENSPGADGLIGTRRAIEAKPDGHTFVVQLPSLLLIRHLPTFKGVDPASQLVPVSAYSVLSGVYVANTAIPGNTLAEVAKYCNTAARPCSFGTTENTARLRLKMLQTDIPSMIVVNYKGGGQLITDLLGNNVNIGSMGYTAVLPHMKTGTLKVLMSSGRQRSPVLPDVPTAAESGFPQLTGETWYGLFAPLGTPATITQSVAGAVREALKDEGLLKAFATLGASPIGSTPEEFVRMIREEDERLTGLVRRFPIE
ncbi:MAG TPA: tripartite tricarboxylate transporter substrate binding protein [Quisquiliibacterium sp.]|nr:tripartite tricarboxylate transporter substrate binding protein [Quisquiliibacterium sp.]